MCGVDLANIQSLLQSNMIWVLRTRVRIHAGTMRHDHAEDTLTSSIFYYSSSCSLSFLHLTIKMLVQLHYFT